MLPLAPIGQALAGCFCLVLILVAGGFLCWLVFQSYVRSVRARPPPGQRDRVND